MTLPLPPLHPGRHPRHDCGPTRLEPHGELTLSDMAYYTRGGGSSLLGVYNLSAPGGCGKQKSSRHKVSLLSQAPEHWRPLTSLPTDAGASTPSVSPSPPVAGCHKRSCCQVGRGWGVTQIRSKATDKHRCGRVRPVNEGEEDT